MSKKKNKSKQTPSPENAKKGAEKTIAVDQRDARGKKNSFKTKRESISLVREVLESVAVALILAFLLRTFQAEAFVIPTGSMAPTLMGRHKDVTCPQCGYPYRVSASEEYDSQTNARKPSTQVVAGTCPQCRFSMYFGPNNQYDADYPTFKGDRILVNKYIFEFRKPRRWEVSVFKYPGEPNTNFIKRIVGLPEETIRIRGGDVFFRPHGDDHFTIARKSSEHLMAMLQLVYDNDYLVDSILELGWPPRWADDQSATEGSSPSWTTEDHRVFSNDGASSEEQWLRYRHIVPSSEDWAYLSQGQMPPYGVRHNPKLVTDFTAYNSGLSISPTTSNVGLIENLSTPSEPRFLARQNPDSMGLNWVGDLALSCELTSESEQGEALFELVEGGVRFQCRIDLSTGLATMLIPGEATFEPVEAETRIRGTGTWKVMFANIDEQLRLWVDRKEIAFPRGAVYQLPLDRDPTEADAMPARIGTFQAALTVDHLQLHRDLYYIAQTNQSPCDIKPFPYVPLNHNTVNSVLSNPLNWSNFGTTHSLEFDMKKEQFLALGDNSASSSDSRLWMSQHHVPHYVPEAYLVGKALLVYWPHGHPVPGMKDLHLIPNVQKMRFIE